MSKFWKYQGLGNDFILIDNRHQSTPIFTSEQSIRLCDRYRGIGGDGVIFVMLDDEHGCDYTMRIFNSDGSEPQMCGNGIRCMAKFLSDLETEEGRTIPTQIEYKIWTGAGVIKPCIDVNTALIKVDMGEPILQGSRIPTTLLPTNPTAAEYVIDAEIIGLDTTYKCTAVSMGNPHCVIFVEDLENMSPSFATIGPIMERHVAFPQRVNAEFVQVRCTQYGTYFAVYKEFRLTE